MDANSCKNLFQNVCKKFSEGTSLHGFLELYYAKNLIFKFVWLVLITGSICVTIYQIYASINNYVYQSSNTIIEPAAETEMIYPPLKLCVAHWLHWADWNKTYALGFTKESALFGLSYLTNIYSSYEFNLSQAEVDFFEVMKKNKFTNLTDFYKAIARVNVVLPRGVLTDIEFFVAELNTYLCYKANGSQISSYLKNPQVDFYLSTISQPNSLTLWWVDSTFKTQNVTQKEYNSYMAEWTFEKNIQYFLYEFGQSDNIENYANVRNNYTSVMPPNVVFVDGYSKMSLKVMPEIDKYFVTVKASAHRWKSTSKNKCQPGLKSFTSDRYCLDYCLASLCKQWKSPTFEYAVIMNNSTEPKNLEKFKILFINESDQTDIMAIAMAMSPVRNILLNSEYQDNVESYSDCWKEGYSKCLPSNCTEGCEKWSFDITVTTSSIYSTVTKIAYKDSNVVSIQYPFSDDVLITTEINSKTWEDFVGNVGGLLGIWTGASILSLFQLFYLCCLADAQWCFCCGNCFKKRQSYYSNKNREKSSSYGKTPDNKRKKQLTRVNTIILSA